MFHPPRLLSPHSRLAGSTIAFATQDCRHALVVNRSMPPHRYVMDIYIYIYVSPSHNLILAVLRTLISSFERTLHLTTLHSSVL